MSMEVKLPPFKKIMADRPTNRQTDRPGYREVSLPKSNLRRQDAVNESLVAEKQYNR